MHRSRMLLWFVVEAQWPPSSYSTDLGYDDGSHWQEASRHGQGSLRGLLVVQQALSLRVAITEGALKEGRSCALEFLLRPMGLGMKAYSRAKALLAICVETFAGLVWHCVG